jgi:ABC-2 type transport system permease protein
MRILSIAFKDFLIILKDKKALAHIVLMPIALILVLGMALSSAFKQTGVSINKFEVAFVDNDRGDMTGYLKGFLESEEVKKMINIKEMSESEALDLVKKGDMAAAIVLPEGFSKSVNEGMEGKIQVYQDPGSPMKGKIVESLIKSFTGVTSAVQTSVSAVGPVFRQYNLDGHMILPEVMKSIGNDSSVEVKETDVEKKRSLSAIQYYSAAMLVMYILFVALLGTTSIIEERENKTLLRLMSTTVKKSTILSGKLLGLVFLGIVDVLILMLFTRLAFGVDWGNSLGGLIILSLAMIFAASGFGMFIATIFKSSKAVNSMSPAMVMVMAFIGGSMFPLFALPPVLQTLSKLTLNNWALRGYLGIMLGDGINSIITPVIVLCAMGTVFLAAGISRLRLD